jgi:hypothetical protein
MRSKEWNISVDAHPQEVWVYHDQEFVARFKHVSPTRSARHFVKFLITNFTPEEYFTERAKHLSPLPILESKGYISYAEEQDKKRGISSMTSTAEAIRNFSSNRR